MKVSVLGAGGWGTTLAILLQKNGLNVTLWEYNLVYCETIRKHRENFYFLPGIKIPSAVKITNNLKLAVSEAELIIVAVPTQFIRHSFSGIKNIDLRDKIIVSVSKGIENNTNLLVSEILSDVLFINKRNFACLSGPSHAEEVSKKIPTAVLCAAVDIKVAKKISRVFSNGYFRVYEGSDVKGTELGGALKNVIAIAAGIAEGCGFGDNTKAALMTRGVTEIMRLGLKLGAKKETFFGLSGIGDLIVTCSSRHSRNRYVGEQIGKGKSLEVVLKKMKMVAEGVATTKSAFELAKKNKIELPITTEVYKILFGNKSPHKAVVDLMNRELKKEH